MASYIELPGDEYGNRAMTNSRARVIEAEERGGRLHVLSTDFAWPVIGEFDRPYWREVEREPGPITEQEWAQIVLSLDGLSEWMIEGATKVQKAHSFEPVFSVDNEGKWEYLRYIPRIYGAMGQPLSWHNERSGVGRTAVLSYLDNRIDGSPIVVEHLHFVIQYIQHYIHAPIWLEAYPMGEQFFAAEVVALREKADAMKTPDDIAAWIKLAMQIGLDPL